MTDDGFDTITKLVDGFATRIRQLKSLSTKEAEIRLEFVDPFFQALGWDVRNSQQKPSWQKDVLVEASLESSDEGRLTTKNPDYLFRAGGFPRFVVEAKRPSDILRNNEKFIFQAKRYAWTAQIPFAILTNFSEFLLFDCTLKPVLNDLRRGMITDYCFTFDQYTTQWSRIVEYFSADAVAAGSLEKLLALIKRVSPKTRIRGIDRLLFEIKGTEPVDRSFLADLDGWRERLARALYAQNRSQFPRADSLEGAARLTEAADRLLDRLVFTRIAEDRGIRPGGTLNDLLERCRVEGGDLYRALCADFRELDRFFNGYLFKPHFTEELELSADILDDLIRNLYYPLSPYRFDVFGDEVLGSIYERFLGKSLTLTNGRITAELKPELRHAGGVFYTPRFIVDGIVERCLSPVTKDKSPEELAHLRILDPACGSGSFLLGAFRFLERAHLAFYASHTQERVKAMRAGRLKHVEDRDQLSLRERLKILTDNLFGVDIDAQAVEVSIMSLYLKALEGQAISPATRELPILPALDGNVRCGNSLISPDIYSQTLIFDDDARFRINAFDWNSPPRGFRDVTSLGGFDAIIGNPPYIRVQEMQRWAPEESEYIKGEYKSAALGNFDIYVPFIEKCLRLLKTGGFLGFICPHKFFQANYGAGLRGQIAAGAVCRYWCRIGGGVSRSSS